MIVNLVIRSYHDKPAVCQYIAQIVAQFFLKSDVELAKKSSI